MPRLLALAALVGVAACGPRAALLPATYPDDFAVAYEWNTGPVSPEYFRTETLDIASSGEGRLASARQEERHEVSFRLTPAQMQALYADLRAAGVAGPFREPTGPMPVGGSSWELMVTADGATVRVPSAGASRDAATKERLTRVLEGAVPAATRAEMDAWIASTAPPEPN